MEGPGGGGSLFQREVKFFPRGSAFLWRGQGEFPLKSPWEGETESEGTRGDSDFPP